MGELTTHPSIGTCGMTTKHERPFDRFSHDISEHRNAIKVI